MSDPILVGDLGTEAKNLFLTILGIKMKYMMAGEDIPALINLNSLYASYVAAYGRILPTIFRP
jgi:hypothetical protein